MNALAIDHGTSKCGLAVAISGIALPLAVVPTKEVFKRLEKEVASRNIDTLVIGIAHHMDGKHSDQATKQKRFAKEVEKFFPKLTIVLWDERLTSLEANHSFETMGIESGGKLDDVAASILLQSYLDSL